MNVEIQRQFGSPGTTRFLRTLPCLRVNLDIPDEFQDLLDQIEAAETRKDSPKSN